MATDYHGFTHVFFQIYVIGEEGILEELKLAGFTGLGGPVRHKYLFCNCHIAFTS